MKLRDVAVATQPRGPDQSSVWHHLAGLRLPPKIAYSVMKYSEKLASDARVIEQNRIRLVYEAAGAEPGTEISLEDGTEQYAKFELAFTEFLDTESDLKPLRISMDDLVSGLDARVAQLHSKIKLLNIKIDLESDETRKMGLIAQRNALAEQLNMISAQELAILEPFFAAPEAAETKKLDRHPDFIEEAN